MEASDGKKPLPVSTYYARLAQRLISALTVATAEGGLYEVDMRLRPTGNKGPVAVSLESFRRYHATRGMDLGAYGADARPRCRRSQTARPKVDAAIRSALTAEDGRMAKDAREMRDKVAAQFRGRNRWDLKFAPGGLVDIEFLAQALQLMNAKAKPGILQTNTIAALEALAQACVLDRARADTMIAAAKLQQALTQILRIAIDGTLDPDMATSGLKTLLARAGGARNFTTLETELAQAQSAVRGIFDELLPAVS